VDLEKLCEKLENNCHTYDVLTGYTHYSFLIGKGYEHLEKIIQYTEEDSALDDE